MSRAVQPDHGKAKKGNERSVHGSEPPDVKETGRRIFAGQADTPSPLELDARETRPYFPNHIHLLRTRGTRSVESDSVAMLQAGHSGSARSFTFREGRYWPVGTCDSGVAGAVEALPLAGA